MGGTKRCPLLNLVGSSSGTTASCDNDHLGCDFVLGLKQLLAFVLANSVSPRPI
jgi:hypothetical protein